MSGVSLKLSRTKQFFFIAFKVDLMAFLADCKKANEQNLSFGVKSFLILLLWDQL